MTEDAFFEFDFTPETHMLVGQSAAPLGWRKCLAELIDNAFDAHATSVAVSVSPKKLVVEDDGIGCCEVDAFFRQGKHRSRNGLGRFGVGLKDASLWMWGKTEVTSRTKQGGVFCCVDWKKIVESNEWKTIAERIDASKDTGTRLTFSGINKRLPREEDFDELGYWFFPAIESGRSIVVRRHNRARKQPIPAYQFPPLEDVIECESEVAGKRFRVRAGVVQEGHGNRYPGFTITYKHRVITTTIDGCGRFGTARFVGVVQLDDAWKLARNKDELMEDGSLLSETLHLMCRDVLEKASEKSRIVQLEGIETAIAGRLQEALADHKKAARSSKTSGKSGTVEPKQTGRKHSSAANLQPGDKRMMSKIGSNITVQFVPDLPKIGQAQFNENGTVVSLNIEHPYVEWAKEHSDTNALTALAATVLSIEASNLTDDKQRHKLMPEIDDEQMRDRFLAGLSLYTSHIQEEQKQAKPR